MKSICTILVLVKVSLCSIQVFSFMPPCLSIIGMCRTQSNCKDVLHQRGRKEVDIHGKTEKSIRRVRALYERGQRREARNGYVLSVMQLASLLLGLIVQQQHIEVEEGRCSWLVHDPNNTYLQTSMDLEKQVW